MNNFKINGEIMAPDEVSLDAFCEMFNKFIDQNNFGFSGFIKDAVENTNDL